MKFWSNEDEQDKIFIIFIFKIQTVKLNISAIINRTEVVQYERMDVIFHIRYASPFYRVIH